MTCHAVPPYRLRRNAPKRLCWRKPRATNCPFLQVPLLVSGVNSLPDAASHRLTCVFNAPRPHFQSCVSVAMPDRAPWRTTTVTEVTSLPPSSPLVSGAEQYSLARLGIASGGIALLLSVAKSTIKNQRAMATPLIFTTLHSWCVAAMRGARMAALWLLFCAQRFLWRAIYVPAAAAALAPINAFSSWLVMLGSGGVWGNTSGCSGSRSAGVDECVTKLEFTLRVHR